MRTILVTLFASAVLFACNSDHDKNSESNEDMNHDEHNTMITTNDPAMPEIPADAKVFFVNLKDGQEVKSPFKVEMGVQGLSVDTANGILKPASGHHHILIDIDSIPTKETVKKDSVHLHFGNAQTSAEITLPPGKHSLTLQFADALHRSYGSKLTSKVTVDVRQ